MGHAGAWAAPGESSAEQKYKALQNAGATMVEHPERFGSVMKKLLSQAGKDVNKIVSNILLSKSTYETNPSSATISFGKPAPRDAHYA